MTATEAAADALARPPAPAHGRKRPRSAVTSGRQQFVLGDPNSAWARRFHDLCQGHVSDLGGRPNISEAQFALVKRAAGLQVELELMEGRLSLGSSEQPHRDGRRRLPPANLLVIADNSLAMAARYQPEITDPATREKRPNPDGNETKYAFWLAESRKANEAAAAHVSAVDLDVYGRAASHLRRILETLGLERKARDVTFDGSSVEVLAPSYSPMRSRWAAEDAAATVEVPE
jgi:hypothetical protein